MFSRVFDDFGKTNQGPIGAEPTVYQKDLSSIQRTLFQFRSAYQHKSLSPSELVAYNKKAHQIQILLNSFIKNTFEHLQKKDMLSCLRNWEELAYDQNQKMKYMIRRYSQIQTLLLNKDTTSNCHKVTTTCERCYQDIRKVNIGEVRGYLENEYIGTLDRMIAEAKVEINESLFTQEQDQIFFKQLHNTLKKKNDQIEFNNKSIEALINKITKQISEINILKKMAMQDTDELEPPSYTWMRNIKSALNDLLQSTFKKKVPTFIEHMVKLFQEHLAQRSKFLLRSMHAQTDEYESAQITQLKQKIIKVNGSKFKLQNDLCWVEHQLQNVKAQIQHKTLQHKQQLEQKWNQLLEERQANKRLKQTIEVMSKDNESIREDLKNKLIQEKMRQKSLRKTQNDKNRNQTHQRRSTRQNTAFRKSMAESIKNSSNFQQQNGEKPRTTERMSNFMNAYAQQNQRHKFKQKFKQGQQQFREQQNTKPPVSKSIFRYRRSQKINQDQQFQSMKLKRKISQNNELINHELVDRQSQNSQISSDEDSIKQPSENQILEVQMPNDNRKTIKPRSIQKQRKIFETQHIEAQKKQKKKKREKKETKESSKQKENGSTPQAQSRNSIKRESAQKFKLNKPKSIIFEEQNSETVSNGSNENQSFVQAVEDTQNQIQKTSIFGSEQASQKSQQNFTPSQSVISQANLPQQSNLNNNKSIFVPREKTQKRVTIVQSTKSYNSNINSKIQQKSEQSSSVAFTTGERKYNEVVRVNQLMEMRIKRTTMIMQNRFSKQNLNSVKTSQKNMKEVSGNQFKIDGNSQEDLQNQMSPNLLRKTHLRSQTMVHTFKSLKDQTDDNQRKSKMKLSTYFRPYNNPGQKDGQETTDIRNLQEVKLRSIFSSQSFDKDLQKLIKQIEEKIANSHHQTSQKIQPSNEENFPFKTLIMEFLQKYGLPKKEKSQKSLKSLKNTNFFERKTNKSVSFFKQDSSLNKAQGNQTSGFAKKTNFLQPIEPSYQKLPTMYKTCFNTPKNQPNSKHNARVSTHNSIKRNVWKSLPDEIQKNQKSLQRSKKSDHSQRPILKDIKKLGHKKYQSCEIEENYSKRVPVKVQIFTKEDFQLFIDEANAYSYECAHMKRQPKQQSLHTEGFDGHKFIDNMFSNIQEIKGLNGSFYDEIVSFIRYPYHTVKNLSWGACMVKGIKYQSFVKFMERIIHLHRKCPIVAELGCCAHLSTFNRKIEIVKRQAGSVGK